MIDSATLSFALSGFRVLNVSLEPDGVRLLLVESVDRGRMPFRVGVISSRIRLPGLPAEGLPARVCAAAVVGVQASLLVSCVNTSGRPPHWTYRVWPLDVEG